MIKTLFCMNWIRLNCFFFLPEFCSVCQLDGLYLMITTTKKWVEKEGFKFVLTFFFWLFRIFLIALYFFIFFIMQTDEKTNDLSIYKSYIPVFVYYFTSSLKIHLIYLLSVVINVCIKRYIKCEYLKKLLLPNINLTLLIKI